MIWPDYVKEINKCYFFSIVGKLYSENTQTFEISAFHFPFIQEFSLSPKQQNRWIKRN